MAVDRKTGTGRVFRREAGGSELTLEAARGRPDHAFDRETGTRWDLLEGEALDGPLAGRPLDPVPAMPAYWFAWAAFYPWSEVRPVED